MNEELRAECGALLEECATTEEYRAFADPIDCTELRNYMDIIRTPICFLDVRRDLPLYGSYDAFVVDMERIPCNCLYYNHHESLIARAAEKLRARIDVFKRQMLERIQCRPGQKPGPVIECRESAVVLEQIIVSANGEEHLASLLAELPSIKTWGDMDTQLSVVKKKYSRYSVNGRACYEAVKEVKTQIRLWFSVDNGRVLSVND